MEGALEYGQELEFENFEFEDEWSGEGEVFSEAELMELAGELLEINSEAELDQFLGKLIKKAGSALGKVVRSPIGKAVGGFLKNAAKKALPLAGAAVGTYFGGPLGAKLGHSLGSLGANALEMETLNAEDREFEGAKQFVRMCGDAAKTALSAPATVNPQAAAKQAVSAAVAKHAPGLLTGKKSAAGARKSRRSSGPVVTGQWVRKGNKILISL
ncbi:hypothetical protein [Candidatus Electronema sp. JM]|uniref:hypothetical protein n=1 Tax=Candidatus Electronema sp. JM TaxID=3401571 RepID=UPI003AA8BE28